MPFQLELVGPEFSITPELVQAGTFLVNGDKLAFQNVPPQLICSVNNYRAFLTTKAPRIKTKRDSTMLPKQAGDTLRD